MRSWSWFPLVLVAVGLPCPVAAQEAAPRVVTLAEAVDVGLREAPTLRMSRLAVEAAGEHLATARAAWFPSLNGTASYTRQNARLGFNPSGGTSGVGGSFDYFSFGLSLTETLDLGRTINVADAAQSAEDAARQDLRTARTATWLAVVQQYYAVLAGQELVTVADRALDQTRRYAARARANFAAGTSPRIDVVTTEADAQNAVVGVLTARDNLAVAKANLMAAMGERHRFPFVVERPPDPDADRVAVDPEAGFQEAVSRRPEREALASRILAQEATVRSLWQQFFPTLSLNAQAADQGQALSGLTGSWNAGATLSLPLLAALPGVHVLREAEANLASLRASLDGVDLQVRLDVEQAAVTLQDARAKLVPLQAALDASKEAQAQAEARYAAGAGNHVELLDAQAAALNAETNLIRARFDLAVAKASWDRALGRNP